MKYIILRIISFYQIFISPDHYGLLSYFKPLGVCKFRPTCSEYAYQAIEKYGIIKGSFLAFRRILKCNPFSNGGYNPVN